MSSIYFERTNEHFESTANQTSQIKKREVGQNREERTKSKTDVDHQYGNEEKQEGKLEETRK